jgi:superoxide dismutase, Fe-Mn family
LIKITAMNKRSFLKSSAMLGAGSLLFSGRNLLGNTLPKNESAEENTFVQTPLEYANNALEPNIDSATMEIHYSKHHAAYTKNLNALVKEQNIQEKDIVKLLGNISKYPAGVRNNGGGFYNHNLYWSVMAPNAGGEPGGSLAKAITSDLGSFAKFKEDFTKAAIGRFGSGWAWLIVKDKKLVIASSPNQDCPLMDISETKGIPVFCIDVWEHAYYLKYQNKRADYVGAYWNVANWKKVEELYQKALSV